MEVNFLGRKIELPVGDLLSYSRPLEYYWIAKYAEIGDDDIVCDVACGNGYWSMILAKKCRYLTAIDYNADRINWANRKYKTNRNEFIVGNAEDMPLESKSYTKVVSVCALEHFQSDIAALKEIRRIIRDGGILAMSVDTLNIDSISDNYINRHKKRCYVFNLYDADSLRKKLEFAGFEMTKYRYITTTRFSSVVAQAAGDYRRLFQFFHPILFPFVILVDALFGSEKHGHKLVIQAKAV